MVEEEEESYKATSHSVYLTRSPRDGISTTDGVGGSFLQAKTSPLKFTQEKPISASRSPQGVKPVSQLPPQWQSSDGASPKLNPSRPVPLKPGAPGVGVGTVKPPQFAGGLTSVASPGGIGSKPSVFTSVARTGVTVSTAASPGEF